MHRLCLLAVAATAALSGCGKDDPLLPPAPARYQAELRYTAYGVAHIRANDMGSVGFGQGYAVAREHACTLVDQLVKVRGERARYLGAGPGNVHLTSDYAFRVLDLVGLANDSLTRLDEDEKELLEGYVAGFNAYLNEPTHASLNLPCAGQPWLGPISVVDLMAYHRYISVLLSSGQLLGAIAAAQPPGGTGGGWLPQVSPYAAPSAESVGSNGWALGAERSASGRGMVLANPHFPWEGELRFHESHLTVPGKLNAYGASVIGIPGIIIGFNDRLAWTYTVAVGARFTAYALRLVPGKPTHYLYDGQEREMSARVITLQVRQPDGSLQEQSRTYYSSHHGPILSLPGVGWTTELALSYRDVNLDNERMLSQFLGVSKAGGMEQFQQVFDTVQGTPWVHTMAADSDGTVWYADAAPVPNLSPATLLAWQQEVARTGSPQSVLARANIILLDGSTSRDEWMVAPGSRSPGLVPTPSTPRLTRRDVVFNANESYWLPHPTITLEGFSPLHGEVRTARSLRTRMNARMLSEVSEGGASGADGRFTLEEVQAAVLSNRSLTAEQLREEVVRRCQATPRGTTQGQSVDLTEACAVLAAWNGRFDAELAGPSLWREFIDAFGPAAQTQAGALFATPFSVSAPVETPNTLVPAPGSGADPVLDRLAAAVLTLNRAGHALTRPLGEVQFAPRAGQRVPVHGGLAQDGVINVVNYNLNLMSSLEPPTSRGPLLNTRTGLTADGYVINGGSSFILATEFVEGGVRARALLTYGQHGNPDSPAFRDQLTLFANKQWRQVAFTEEEISNAPGYETRTLTHD